MKRSLLFVILISLLIGIMAVCPPIWSVRMGNSNCSEPSHGVRAYFKLLERILELHEIVESSASQDNENFLCAIHDIANELLKSRESTGIVLVEILAIKERWENIQANNADQDRFLLAKLYYRERNGVLWSINYYSDGNRDYTPRAVYAHLSNEYFSAGDINAK